MTEWIQLLGGGLLVYAGAEWFVAGASSLALALRLPQLLVGLTVVAYGTSAPEIVVGIQAAAAGHGEVALGNVLGSNIANIGLILGLAAMIKPARVDGQLRRREVPVLLASMALVPLLLANGVVSKWEGASLVLAAVVYTVLMVHAARSASAVAEARVEVRSAEEAADLAGGPRPSGKLRSAAIAVAGLGVLLVGGHIFVRGAVEVARTLGMSDRLVGLTIVAVGTSLPELVTSVIAARRGHADLAVGNVVGSNIFNILLCLGTSALAGSVAVPLRTVAVDVAALAIMTLFAALLLREQRTISRAEGAFALVLYLSYTALIVAMA
ncbi:MAG: calcium/sodium antiporter [Deltaproteobacteria bacterium]|nr:calcium/sodium antiporter [Deltaproteobacteria bacterium]